MLEGGRSDKLMKEPKFQRGGREQILKSAGRAAMRKRKDWRRCVLQTDGEDVNLIEREGKDAFSLARDILKFSHWESSLFLHFCRVVLAIRGGGRHKFTLSRLPPFLFFIGAGEGRRYWFLFEQLKCALRSLHLIFDCVKVTPGRSSSPPFFRTR